MKPFTAITVAFLTLIAIGHLARLFAGWEVTMAGVVIPVWASAPGTVFTGGLAFMVWRESRP